MCIPWQLRKILLIAVLGPPAASIAILLVTYLPVCAGTDGPVNVPCIGVVVFFFAIPLGFTFGIVPALLTGATYCYALTAIPTLQKKLLPRACDGAAIGGLIGETWFQAAIGTNAHLYGLVTACVAAAVPALELFTGTGGRRIGFVIPASRATLKRRSSSYFCEGPSALTGSESLKFTRATCTHRLRFPKVTHVWS